MRARAAQDLTESRNALDVIGPVLGWINERRSKLEYVKFSTIGIVALMSTQNGSSGFDPDPQRN